MSQEFKPTHAYKYPNILNLLNKKLEKLSEKKIANECCIYVDINNLVYYCRDAQVTPILTPTQMLEAAQAKGIEWTKKWPKVSGWYPASMVKDALLLRYIDVEACFVSAGIHYAADHQFIEKNRYKLFPKDSYDDLYFAEPWWVQS